MFASWQRLTRFAYETIENVEENWVLRWVSFKKLTSCQDYLDYSYLFLMFLFNKLLTTWEGKQQIMLSKGLAVFK